MLSEGEWKKIAGDQLRLAHDNDVLLIGNICASSLENWTHLARMMEDSGIEVLELNLGNPHHAAARKPMGAKISQSEEILAEVVEAVAGSVSIPVITKLSPQVSNMVQVARLVKKAGASAVTISHRFQGWIIDIEKQESLSSALFGYGGPWMLPVALGYVANVSREVPIPICGSGGVSRWSDVLQMIMAGATTVQMTTALMLKGMKIVPEMLEHIATFCNRHGIDKLEGLIGAALRKEGTLDRLPEHARAAIQQKPFCLKCVNKPCIVGCYFDAILLREDQSVEILTDQCTTCGLCTQMCPYPGALAIVT
jgi:dihydroorotate dehydrogenase subfamily 1